MKGPENDIAALIREKGPLTGAEIKARTSCDSLTLWQTCLTSRFLTTRTFGRQYLRLDAQVEGYARLSPSILREFFTYSLVGLAGEEQKLEARCLDAAARIEAISLEKHSLAAGFVADIRAAFKEDWPDEGLCAILAGDVVYKMAHRVPRPERSTGKLVDGSDIDLVIVLADELPDSFAEKLDREIYRRKYQALISPSVREEIDYVVKKMARVEEQLRFDSFRRMVACKILNEGVLLEGSRSMFEALGSKLGESGVTQKLAEMEKGARLSRQERQEHLLRHCRAETMSGADRTLFYSAEESEEFE